MSEFRSNIAHHTNNRGPKTPQNTFATCLYFQSKVAKVLKADKDTKQSVLHLDKPFHVLISVISKCYSHLFLMANKNKSRSMQHFCVFKDTQHNRIRDVASNSSVENVLRLAII